MRLRAQIHSKMSGPGSEFKGLKNYVQTNASNENVCTGHNGQKND